MAITSIDVNRGFDFDKVESKLSLSMFLKGMWNKLSADDKYEIVEILWGGFNKFITPHRNYLAGFGLPSDEMKTRINAVAPEIDESFSYARNQVERPSTTSQDDSKQSDERPLEVISHQRHKCLTPY